MKKQLIFASIAIAVSVCLIIAVFSYAFIDKPQLSGPPTLEEAEKYFEENRKDLEIVVDFLLNEENDVVIVRYAHRWENWNNTEITKEVRGAIKRLRNGQSRIRVTKDEYKIGITIWFPTVLEMSSGFAYSINGKEPPAVQYATTMQPLTEPGWYFYIEDFNTWRDTAQGTGLLSPFFLTMRCTRICNKRDDKQCQPTGLFLP